jgi:hypothetical protein
MNNEIKVMNNDEIRDFCIKKDLKIFELEQELRQKENIIKEAKDFINGKDLKENEYRFAEDFNFTKLLEILDDEKV